MRRIANKAARYRECADEVRALAQLIADAEHSSALLSIAANYDRLAAAMERDVTFQENAALPASG